MRKRYALPAYVPDQPPVGEVLTKAENIFATAGGGYRPAKALVSQTAALPYAFGGGGAFIASSSSAYLIAGTDGGIYKLAGSAWTSLVTSTAGRWRFSQFANYVVAVNGSATKVLDLNAGTGANLAAAPTGTSVAVVGQFVVIGQAGGDKLKVQWSATDDHTSWTPAVNQSGFQGMNDGGEVMGLAGGEYGVILQRFALTRMSRSGDSLAPFSFDQITSNVGCASKASAIQAGRSVFFWSDRGFMSLEDGQQIKPIGTEKVDSDFRAFIPTESLESIYVAVDPKSSVVLWGVPGSPGRVWAYNWVLDHWTTLSFSFAGIFSGYSSSTTLEAYSALYPNLDTAPYSLDDVRFQGGDPKLFVVGADGTVGTLSGATMAATITHGWVEPIKGKRTRLRAAWLISDAVDGVTASVDARQRLGDTVNARSNGAMQPSGRIPLRISGRVVQPSFTIAAGTVWTHVEGFELEGEAGGER